MLDIDINNLNALEKQIHEKITAKLKQDGALTITQAAALCDCSASKISKYVKKLGFQNYKQYMDFMCGKEIPRKESSSEFDRIRNFMDEFDLSLIDRFIDLIHGYEKIILLGYGPSRYCAQYFEFRLQLIIKQTVIAVADDISARALADDKTLLIIFSATGTYLSFDNVVQTVHEKGGQSLLIAEEYNPSIIPNEGMIYFLTNSSQTFTTIPYEKSRAVFFIFIEEVIHTLLLRRGAAEE